MLYHKSTLLTMNSDNDCEQTVIKQEDELLPVTEMKTELQDVKCEIKLEPEDYVEFRDTEQDDADVKDQILAEPQFASTMKTESEEVDKSDFLNDMKQENTEMDETIPIVEDSECLAKNLRSAKRDLYYACNTSREKLHIYSSRNTAAFQSDGINNLKPEAADKSSAHMQSHGGDEHCECKVCTHTGQNKFKCKICNKAFIWKTSLFKHLHSHDNEKPFSCEFCGKSFSLKYYLTRHLKVHYPVKPYICDICSKSFSEKSLLTKHIYVHSGEKRIMCEICNKYISCKSNLEKHKRIHDGDKPFRCEICGKSFARNTYFDEHMQLHNGERPFSCNICDKSFNKKFNLSRHMRVHSRKTF